MSAEGISFSLVGEKVIGGNLLALVSDQMLARESRALLGRADEGVFPYAGSADEGVCPYASGPGGWDDGTYT